MPGLDGFELAEKIKEEKLNVKSTLMLTSDERPELIERLKFVGVENYLVKPLKRDDRVKAKVKTLAMAAVV